MDIWSYLRAIRRSWWVVVLATVLGASGGLLLVLLSTPMYASSVTFFVNTPADATSSLYQNDQFGQKRINTYVQMISSDQLSQMVVSASGVDLSPGELEKELSAKGDLNTVLMTATVTDASKARSLALARAVSTQMVDLVAEFETPPGSKTSAVNLRVISGPTLNPTPVSPRPTIYVGLGIVIGLLVGLLVAVLRDLLDTSIRSMSVLATLTKIPVLGVIPFDSSARRSPVLMDANARSVRAESFRRLRTSLQFLDVDTPVKVIAVTSAVPGEGKSTTATNLAVTFAEMGKRVLVIEGDLRRPRLSQYFGLEGEVGLSNVVAGQVPLIDVLQPWGSSSLMVLPSGSIPPNPSELLGSTAMIELIRSARQTFDTVIIDTPPLLPVTDGAIIAAHTDGAVLVVRQGKTTRHQVTRALAALHSVDARVLGIVMNMSRSSIGDRYSSVYDSDFDRQAPGKSRWRGQTKRARSADVERVGSNRPRTPVLQSEMVEKPSISFTHRRKAPDRSLPTLRVRPQDGLATDGPAVPSQ